MLRRKTTKREREEKVRRRQSQRARESQAETWKSKHC
jgi:hypothetical protein